MNGWIRVTKQKPCPICQHSDWCCIGERFINCMRVSGEKLSANGGWLYPIGDAPKPYQPRVAEPPRQTINAFKMMRDFSAATWPKMQTQFAASLGVTVAALCALGCAWAPGHNAWAFPMKDWSGNIIGIRLRDVHGNKWAVKGSKAGLFYAEGEAKMAVIVEGPTDAAAGLSIGLSVIGRPSCLGCESEIVRLLKRKNCQRAVIIADNDDPGIRGAVKLRDQLPIPSCIAVLPAKDLRSFVACEGTAELFYSIVDSLVWNQPTKLSPPSKFSS